MRVGGVRDDATTTEAGPNSFPLRRLPMFAFRVPPARLRFDPALIYSYHERCPKDSGSTS